MKYVFGRVGMFPRGVILISAIVIFLAGCASVPGIIDVESTQLDTVYISPANNDGIHDELIIPLDIVPGTKIVVRGFRFAVSEAGGKVVYSFENNVAVPGFFAGKKERAVSIDIPREISWNGSDMDGNYVADGVYTYYAEAWDGYGNTGRSPDFKVVVDNTYPVAELASPFLIFSPNGDGRKDMLEVEHQNVSDEDLWTGAILDGNGKVVKTFEWPGVPEPLRWDGLDSTGVESPDGFYFYRLSSTDRAGNTFSTELAGVTIDTRPNPINLTVSIDDFSPNNDGIKDTVVLVPFLERRENAVSWNIDITDENSDIRRSFNGDGLPPAQIVFDGKSPAGSVLEDGTYSAILKMAYTDIRGHVRLLAGQCQYGRTAKVHR